MESQVELAVDMTSASCAEKIEKALKNIDGVTSFDISPSRQSVLVKSNVMAETLRNTVEKETGITAVVMGQGSVEKENLGSAVAAIAYGPSQVRGLLRITQISKETCIIEGNLDGFSSAKNVCVSVHECGDLSDGCESCGSSYRSNDASTKCEGIISSLSPNNNGSIEFRLPNSNLKVSEMIGRSIVVHEGLEKDVQENKSKRLACGIIARSSGLFQNSKRFCACDGVTLWEEKKRLQESDKILFNNSK